MHDKSPKVEFLANIDNGFGAACTAVLIAKQSKNTDKGRG